MAARTNDSNGSNGIAEINVIPLVDIILVVLIIFMVAAPLVMTPKIDINLPSSSTAKVEKESKPMRLVLGKDGELFLNNEPATVQGIVDEAKRMVVANPETGALLIADKNATLEMVTELVDAVKTGGIKKVAFSIQKKN